MMRQTEDQMKSLLVSEEKKVPGDDPPTIVLYFDDQKSVEINVKNVSHNTFLSLCPKDRAQTPPFQSPMVVCRESSVAAPNNSISFDSKVVSRLHCSINRVSFLPSFLPSFLLTLLFVLSSWTLPRTTEYSECKTLAVQEARF